MGNTLVKVVAVVAERGEAGWPSKDWPYEKELDKIMEILRSHNPDMTFDVAVYTKAVQAEACYEEDRKKYAGVLVLQMTCWKYVDEFYIRQSREGIPTIVADVPFFGSGSTLAVASEMIRKGKYPVPLLSTTDYTELAQMVRCFAVIDQMKHTRILVVSTADFRDEQIGFEEIWGCEFVNCGSEELNAYIDQADYDQAVVLADRWIQEADAVYEPSREEIIKAAELHLAVKAMMKAYNCSVVTLDCLRLSYTNKYRGSGHIYPCMSHFEMLKNGILAVCEADAYSSVASLLIKILTGRPGFVSDPVIDTSNDQIIYAHCVACNKLYGAGDPRTCRYVIRSHAEDNKGASVQVQFPEGDKLTTIQTSVNGKASIHSSVSQGSYMREEGCRSKLAAKVNAEKVLKNWGECWHRVTVFGDYRKLFLNLFLMKGIEVLIEDE